MNTISPDSRIGPGGLQRITVNTSLSSTQVSLIGYLLYYSCSYGHCHYLYNCGPPLSKGYISAHSNPRSPPPILYTLCCGGKRHKNKRPNSSIPGRTRIQACVYGHGSSPRAAAARAAAWAAASWAASTAASRASSAFRAAYSGSSFLIERRTALSCPRM